MESKSPPAIPEWIPDWSDEMNYKDHGDDLEAWAWEFLRRNSEYQAGYRRWALLPDNEVAPDGVLVESAKYRTSTFIGDSMIYYHADPPALADETVSDYEARTGQSVKLLTSYLCERWKIAVLKDPARSGTIQGDDGIGTPPYGLQFTDPTWHFGPRTGFPYAPEYMADRLLYAPWPANEDSHMMSFAFDIRMSIPDQLRAAGLTLLETKRERELAAKEGDALGSHGYVEKQKAGLGQKNSYTGWLRLLDAVQTGATDDQIVNQIYPGESKPTPQSRSHTAKLAVEDEQRRFFDAGVRWKIKTLPKAQEMVREGYQRMLFWAQLPVQQRNTPQKARK